MEWDSDVDVIIFSESEESEEAIRAQADRGLPFSIISKATVNRLRVPYTLCRPAPVKDSRGTSHCPIGRVELRWHKRDKAKSYPELFYVVESTTSFVILGASAFSQGDQSAGSEVHTLGLTQQTAGMARPLVAE